MKSGARFEEARKLAIEKGVEAYKLIDSEQLYKDLESKNWLMDYIYLDNKTNRFSIDSI